MHESTLPENRPLRLLAAWSQPFLACLVEWVLWDEFDPYVWVLFYPTVFVALRLGGFWGGIGATLISAVLGWYVVIPPPWSFAMDMGGGHYSTAVFIGMGIAFSLLHRRLRANEAQYCTLFERAGDGILILDADGRCVDANARYCSLLDRPRAKILGTSVASLAGDGTPAWGANAGEALAAEGTATFRRRLRRQDGTDLPVELTITSLPNSQRLAVVRDISERLRAAEAAAQAQAAVACRHSEERLRLAQQAAQVGIWDWQLASGQLDWTPELEAIYGYAPGEFPGNYAGFRDRVHPEDLAQIERRRDAAVAAHQPFDWREANSLGLQLVQLFADQLDAEIEVDDSRGGTEFAVAFGGAKP